MATEAQRKAAQKYKTANAKQYSFCFLRDRDADIISALDGQENKQGYVKALIRADIARNATETKENQSMKSGFFFDSNIDSEMVQTEKKEHYEELEIEVIDFQYEDVITCD